MSNCDGLIHGLVDSSDSESDDEWRRDIYSDNESEKEDQSQISGMITELNKISQCLSDTKTEIEDLRDIATEGGKESEVGRNISKARIPISARKAQRKARKENSKNVTEGYEAILRIAQRAYERFMNLPKYTSTPKQIELSSAGVHGWLRYATAMTEMGMHNLVDEGTSLSHDIMFPGSIRGSRPDTEDGSRTELQNQHANEAKSEPKPLCKDKGEAYAHFSIKSPSGPELKGFKNLAFLGEVKPSISAMGPGSWTEIVLCVDSGACETVMPLSLLNHISIVSSPQSSAGVEYEVANGASIPNVGERRLDAVTINASDDLKIIHMQVANVHKCLLSVSKCADMGYTCVLNKDGGYLIDEATNEKIPIERRGNLYEIRMMVRGGKRR